MFFVHGVGHQQGLDQEDALELMQSSAFILGMVEALEIGDDQMWDILTKYRDKYDAYFKAKNQSDF